MDNQEVSIYLQPGCRIHMVGIGGVSMMSLALVLQQMGVIVTGSDMQDSDGLRQLEEKGIRVFVGHRPDHVGDAQAVIRTAAAHNDNPEIAWARQNGIPIIERAQAWGVIMGNYKNALCIAGTHGKTTTTGMCTHILLAAHRDPTVMIGGTLPLLESAYRIGDGDTIVLESCEYFNSFLSFSPTVAVILNVEPDHLDFFKDLADIQDSFRKFARLVPEEDGLVVSSAEDPGAVGALKDLDRPMLTFGLEQGDVHAENLTWDHSRARFDIICQGEPYAHVELGVPGLHNVKNALAAAAAAYGMDVEASAVEEGLASFTGAKRRFEYKGSFNGADIYDDYAHHPSELAAILDMVDGMGYDRVICVFQPHTYSRTKALFDQFVEVLKRPDIVLIAEIYAARETNTERISSADLANQIPGSLYLATFGQLNKALRETARPGDIILTVGAGDIYTVGDQLIAGEN